METQAHGHLPRESLDLGRQGGHEQDTSEIAVPASTSRRDPEGKRTCRKPTERRQTPTPTSLKKQHWPGSGSSAGSGGGGSGLNEITTIAPTTAGAPGSVIALVGSGLDTTRAVYSNEHEGDFSVIDGSHVEVTVPVIPSGVYVVYAVLDPRVGRESYWNVYHVLAPGNATVTPDDGQTPISIANGRDSPSSDLVVRQTRKNLRITAPGDWLHLKRPDLLAHHQNLLPDPIGPRPH